MCGCTYTCLLYLASQCKTAAPNLLTRVVLNTTGANKYAFQILPLLLDGCRSPEASIRQSALYGLGSVAEHRPQLFQAVAQDALTRIMAVISAPNSRYCCHLCWSCAHSRSFHILPEHCLEHLHNVEMCFYCLQTFLRLDFQCTDECLRYSRQFRIEKR